MRALDSTPYKEAAGLATALPRTGRGSVRGPGLNPGPDARLGIVTTRVGGRPPGFASSLSRPDLQRVANPAAAQSARIARSLGLRVVTEDVEALATLAPLRETGCNLVRGGCLAWSMPGTSIGHWLAR